MKWRFLIVLLAPACCIADPFYGKAEAQSATSEYISELAKNSENQTACTVPEGLESLSLEEPFAKLQFIGVLKQNEQIKALFSNENKQIIEMHENQLITHDDIQIHKIEMRAIHYIQWKNTSNCETPQITIKRL